MRTPWTGSVASDEFIPIQQLCFFESVAQLAFVQLRNWFITQPTVQAIPVFILASPNEQLPQQVSILLVSIQAEFGASDTAMGFLTGLAFAVTNAVAGIPLARLADRRSRTLIVVLGLAAWSALTTLQGLAHSFVMLAAARIGVGIGEASTGPASHSLLSDLFTPQRRATRT